MLLRINVKDRTVVDAVTMERVGVVTPTREADPNLVQISVQTDAERIVREFAEKQCAGGGPRSCVCNLLVDARKLAAREQGE